jgi:hypothetical protein
MISSPSALLPRGAWGWLVVELGLSCPSGWTTDESTKDYRIPVYPPACVLPPTRVYRLSMLITSTHASSPTYTAESATYLTL